MKKRIIDLLLINRPLLYLYIILLFGSFALLGTDQSIDLYVSFLDTYIANRNSLIKAITGNEFYFVKFTIALTAWSLTMWYSAKLTLQFSNLSSINDTALNSRLVLWLPSILGIIPFFIPLYGFLMVDDSNIYFPLILLFLAGSCFAFFIIKVKSKQDKAELAPRGWKKFPKDARMVIYFVWCLGIILLVLFTLPASLRIAQWFRPGTIIVSSLISLTISLTILAYKDSRTALPLALLIVLALFIFSYFNNNHEIRTEDQGTEFNNRVYFSKYFDDWLKDKDSLSKDSIPVYILAAEGGGIRALNWTALALANLSREDSTFYNHIIAISGVSGGSIGALFYTCLINDFGKVQSDSLYTLFKGALRQDFLSPVTAALLYPDFIQRFLPFKIHYLDRARWLEDAWAKAYQSHLSKDSFNKPFLSLWNRDTSTKPCIFINGTLSETGQKAILSNIILEKKYFHDVIDIYSVINKEVLIKTAGLLSARFPLITPGGLIKSREGRPFGHIVDGGYVENTALGTAVQVLNQVLDLIDTSNHILSIGNSTKLRVKPTLIFIKNGDTNYDSMKIQKFAYEAIIPVNAFLKSWGRSGESTAYSVRQITDRVRPKIKFMKFELDRKVKNPRGKNINLPLGWFLSETAASEIARQAELLDIR